MGEFVDLAHDEFRRAFRAYFAPIIWAWRGCKWIGRRLNGKDAPR